MKLEKKYILNGVFDNGFLIKNGFFFIFIKLGILKLFVKSILFLKSFIVI